MLQSSVYVGISAQIALLRRLDTLANNLANQGTAGYRAEQVTFSSIASAATAEAVDFVSPGATSVVRETGELVQTGNPLDIAVRGEAWLAVETPFGQAYTRDGRLTLTPTGELRTSSGYKLLDPSGAPLQINPQDGAIDISAGGAVSQAGKQVAAVGLFRIDRTSTLERLANGAFLSASPGEPMSEAEGGSIMQGYVERSNSNPILDMAKLIAVQRAFDSVSTTIGMIETSHTDAIRALGGM